MTLEPETWQLNTDLGLFPLSEHHCMSLVNNLSFVAFLRKFKRIYKESESRLVVSDSFPSQTLQVKVLKWVAYPFSGGSSLPRNQTRVPCIADSLPTELSEKPKKKKKYIKKKLVCLYYSKSSLYCFIIVQSLVTTSLCIFVVVILFL